MGNHTALDPFVEEEADRFPAALAVVERPVVDVHSDKGVGLAAIETAGKAHRMIERALSVIKSVSNALTKVPGHLFLNIAGHVLSDDVAAQRQWKAGLFHPPSAHIGYEVETFILIGKLTFVDQQAGIDVATLDGPLDLIEGHHNGLEVRLVQLQREVRARHHSRDGNALVLDIST